MSQRRSSVDATATTERTFVVEGAGACLILYGEADRNLRALRAAFPVRFHARDGRLSLSGSADDVAAAAQVVERLVERARSGRPVTPAELERWIGGDTSAPAAARAPKGSLVQPRSPGQHGYLQAMRECDLVFALGPAGTGKTYLAVAHGVAALRAGRARRLVLTRPAVEAGEHLGFLPGDFQAKVNPYLRPLYDALNDFLSPSEVRRNMDRDIFEIAPLAYMRGRTLNESVVILDEGQNTTVTQMKMFLTRLGSSSQMIVTGDTTQVDLPPGTRSGLLHAARLLDGVPGIGVARLGKADIVRHPLVQRVVDAYADDDAAERGEAPGRGDAPA